MNIKILPVLIILLVFLGCTKTIETEFGNSCKILSFSTEKKMFSSNPDGSIKFFLDESTDKSSGKLLEVSLPEVSAGVTDWIPQEERNEENCTDCIYLFVRQADGSSIYYRAESARINVEDLYYDTKGRVSFMKGSFERMVFNNTDKNECTVIENVSFILY